METFDDLPLHDAIIDDISINWQQSRIEFRLTVLEGDEAQTSMHKLSFTGVTEFFCPHLSPWGESSSINSVSTSGDVFEIEMQSGDVLEFKADSFEYI